MIVHPLHLSQVRDPKARVPQVNTFFVHSSQEQVVDLTLQRVLKFRHHRGIRLTDPALVHRPALVAVEQLDERAAFDRQPPDQQGKGACLGGFYLVFGAVFVRVVPVVVNEAEAQHAAASIELCHAPIAIAFLIVPIGETAQRFNRLFH